VSATAIGRLRQIAWRRLIGWLAGALAVAFVAAPPAGARDPATGIEAVTNEDFFENGAASPQKIELGRLLFFDKILSGNRNIACASCHHPRFATSDGLVLPLGEGAVGVGPQRHLMAASPVIDHVPRNSQALFNLGASEFVQLFFDGRVARDPERYWSSGFRSPALQALPSGLDNVLAAQAMLPVTSEAEMAGQEGENLVADAAGGRTLAAFSDVWTLLAERLRAIPEYVELFKAAYPEITGPSDMTFVHAANAIAAFEVIAFRADASPFDDYLRSRDPSVLEPAAYRGMVLFYGKAGCARCHGGKFLTDQLFHAIAMPQIGPGKNHGIDNSYWLETGFLERVEDWGRYGFTRKLKDKFSFRTPSLRNIALTGPWGHAGTYSSLEEVVRHHLDPLIALESYDVASAQLVPIAHAIERRSLEVVTPERLDDYQQRAYWVQHSPKLRQSISAANVLAPRTLGDSEVADLVVFLDSLTDPTSRDLDHLIPERVPSGLQVDR
jgi:cytochrome c peroxidase